MPIDLSLPPYNVKGDWSDNGSAIQDAADFYGQGNGTHPDNGGAIGETLLLPAGTVVSNRITLPYGIALQGVNDYGTHLVASAAVTGEVDFIQQGDPALTYSTFGGKLRHMLISCSKTQQASSSVCAVRCTSVQDGTVMDHVRVYGNKRRGIIAEKGQGGATRVHFNQVTANTSTPGFPAITFDYGEGTIVHAEGLEPSGARVNPADPNSPAVPGTIGVLVKGGIVKIEQFHPELLESGMVFNLTPRPNTSYTESFCHVDWSTGGPGVRDLFVVSNNTAQLGRIRLSDIRRNGTIRHTVYNGQQGASHIDTDIIAQITL